MTTAAKVRALSIQQPWAWLIAHGHKDIENRTWRTHYRGEFLIHAGKRFDTEGYEWVRTTFPEIPEIPEIPMPPRGAFETGGIVGRARLLDCVYAHPSPWFFGPFGFVLVDAEPLPFRECRGRLGFFEVES